MKKQNNPVTLLKKRSMSGNMVTLIMVAVIYAVVAVLLYGGISIIQRFLLC